jgi:hypothetical protein
MRKQADTPAEKGPEAARLAEREEAKDVQADCEVGRMIDRTRQQPIEQAQLAGGVRRGGIEPDDRIGRRGQPQRGAVVRKRDDECATFDGRDLPDAKFRVEAVGQPIADRPPL